VPEKLEPVTRFFLLLLAGGHEVAGGLKITPFRRHERNFVTRSTGSGTYQRNVAHPLDLASHRSGQLVHDQTTPANRHDSPMKMKLIPSAPSTRGTSVTTTLITALLALGSIAVQAAAVPLLLDDYSDPTRNKNGIERLLIDDKAAGSKSHATQKCENGVLAVKGDLVPGRGVPAFISQVSLLSADGKPKDLTGYQGVRLRVKVTKGILYVQVGSSEIDNFDYHTGAPIAGKRGEFQEVRIPFKEMKRAWSAQTVLNLKSITSVNLVSFATATDAFAYEVDEIGFY
jgi:hypothetical protein